MSFNELVRKDILTVDADASVSEILDLFEKQRDLIVVSHGSFYEGIVNESLAYKLNIDPTTTKVRTVMKVAPKLDGNESVGEISKLMVESGFKTLPYVLQDGTVAGGVFADDVIALSENLFRNVSVKDVMTANPVTIEKSATIGQLLSLMRSSGLSRIIVVEDHEIAGIVTLHDIIQKVIKPRFRQRRDRIISDMKKLTEYPVTSIMTESVITIDEDVNAYEAYKLMKKYRFSSVVVTKKGFLTGIVTKEDLLRQIALSTTALPSVFVQLSKKGIIESLEYDPETIRSRIDSVIRKYRKVLENSVLTVYINGDKMQKRGKPHILIRIQVNGPYVNNSVTGEGWGIKNALVDATHKLEKVLEKVKFTLTKKATEKEVQELLESVLP
ncbi:MAG: CBS domain-containing protein [Nitrososphaeria archaeon]